MNRVTLGDVAKERRETCKRDKSRYPVVGLEHLTPEEIILTEWDESGENTFTKMFHKGDMLFGRRRSYLKKAAVAPFDGICSGDITVIEAKPDFILPELLPFVIQNDAFFDFAVEKSAGSLSPRAKWEHLKDYEFNLSSMYEQRKLARVLWAVNDTIEAYKKLIAATDELVKAQFVEMFGDPIKNEKGWPVCRLCDVAEIRIGPFGTLLHKEDYIENGHPLVNPSHIIDGKIVVDPKLTITDSKYKELSAYHLRVGDIVLGRRGEMGRCAVVHDDGLLCGTGSMIIRPNSSMKAYFLQNIIASPAYREIIENKAVGVTMMNINVPIVSELTMPLLPMELQERYITFLTQTDKSKFELERALTTAKAVMKGIVEENICTHIL